MEKKIPKPDLEVMRRVEELLRDELLGLGEDISELPPHEISKNMHCGVHDSGALSYSWKGVPILDVDPEVQPDGSIRWRFFTRDTPTQ